MGETLPPTAGEQLRLKASEQIPAESGEQRD
jgi:hypothetical protein